MQSRLFHLAGAAGMSCVLGMLIGGLFFPGNILLAVVLASGAVVSAVAWISIGLM